MLNIARGSFNLKDFEARLQQHLQEFLGEFIPITVSCGLTKNKLMIVVQTPNLASVSPAKVFAEIKNILPQESIPESLKIQMGLIIHDGQSFEETLEVGFKSNNSLFLPPVITREKSQLEQLTKNSASRLTDFQQQIYPQLKFYLSKLSSKTIAGISIGLILLLGGVYIISRPCSFGSCEVIPQSQALAQEAVALIDTYPSAQNFATAQQKLNQAINQLNKIPWWSNYYSQCHALLTVYQARLDSLELIIIAREKAFKAVSLADNSTLPASRWREIESLWTDAIALLNQLPPESPFFSFAQEKNREYQRNLISVRQRLQAEKQAQVSLREAQKAAKIAQVRQKTAQSVGDWRLVQGTWQTVIKRLQEIAPGTTSYQQGQQLLDNYIYPLTQSRTRLQQEELAQKLYDNALKEAQMAEKSQQGKQWSAAVSSWRKAIISLKQIQPNTFKASQAQSLINGYMIALNQAEGNLKNALKFQQLRQSLAEVCANSQKICSYKITQNTIKVNLTPIYMQKVWQTALQAKAQSNINTQIELLNHISYLEKTWQTISNKFKKTVEVYNPQGELMVTYEPK